MKNGIVKVELIRGESEDSYKVEIDSITHGELLQVIIQLVIAINGNNDEPLENIIGSIYQGCLTPDEIKKLEDAIKDDNKALKEFEEMVGNKDA